MTLVHELFATKYYSNFTVTTKGYLVFLVTVTMKT